MVQVESQAAEDYELISNKVFDLELMGEEDKRIKSELEEDLSRSRLELRQALSELQVQKEQMRQRQQSKDKEVTITCFLSRKTFKLYRGNLVLTLLDHFENF